MVNAIVAESHSYGERLPPIVSRPSINTPPFWLVLGLGLIYCLTTAPGFQHPSTWALSQGVLYTPWVLHQHEWWRVLTCQLLHASPLHLLSNTMAIALWGGQLWAIYQRQGRALAWWWVLLGSIVGTGLVCVLVDSWTLQPRPVLGASGISYGFLAANAVVFWPRYSGIGGQLRAILGWGLLLMAYTYYHLQDPQLSAAGHIGGFLGGLITALGVAILLQPRR